MKESRLIRMHNLTLVKVKSPEQGAEHLFQFVKDELQLDQLHVIGLATGSTMIPVYQKWTESNLDFSKVIAFNLDEYVGLASSNPNSYAYFMQHHLFSKKPFKETYIPNGLAEDVDKECEQYEALLQKYPLDLQLLGVGENGHIAFNEPGTSFDSLTHVATLTESTLGVNSQYFENDEKIPETAFTMGITSITRAKKIVLLAFGEKKRAAIEKLLAGEVTTEWPITKLLMHPHVTVITDLDVE